jgi:hypothetical protein
MSWVRVDDQFFRHPKVLDAGRDARDLYLVGLCYCAQGLTDGFIPGTALRVLGAEAEIDQAQASADRLVAVGLWEAVEGGYNVHDYLEYQPTKERVIATREVRAEAGRRGGKQKASNLLDKTLAKPKQNSAPSQSHPVPIPSTSPDGEEPPVPPATDAPPAAPKAISRRQEQGFDAFWQAWPKKEGKAKAQTAWARIRPDPDTIQAILDAIPRHQAAKDWPRENWRFCPLPATWLNERRWDDELPDTVPRPFAPIGRDAERVAVMQRFAARRQLS